MFGKLALIMVKNNLWTARQLHLINISNF